MLKKLAKIFKNMRAALLQDTTKIKTEFQRESKYLFN
jgi:hypothetical protein